MKIQGMNSSVQPTQGGMAQGTDAVSKSLQNQIANAQKQLQELSENNEITPDQKMKKRQEIQKQISELNMQLKQHQMELRKEKQEKKETQQKTELSQSKIQTQGTGLSQNSMKAMLTADSAISQSQIQGKVATEMEDRAGVLKAQIKSGNGSVELHQEELVEVERTAQNAKASQIDTLDKANNVMENAAKAENEAGTENTANVDNTKNTTNIENTIDAQRIDSDIEKNKEVETGIKNITGKTEVTGATITNMAESVDNAAITAETRSTAVQPTEAGIYVDVKI